MNQIFPNQYTTIFPSYLQYLAYFNYQQQTICHYNAIRHIMHTIESIFTKEHLNKDVFIRSIMDKEGWVNTNYICCYNKIKKFKISKEMLRHIILKTPSTEIEYELRGEQLLFIRSSKWNEMKQSLQDLAELKRNKIGIIQNKYITTKTITKPKLNMRPMRSVFQKEDK